jgi:NAD(P)H dehydrogenase (quinone)
MKIGITGATGQLGRLVIEKLTEKGLKENVVALARSPQKAADLGVEVREFNYSQPTKLADALNGIDCLLLISGNEFGQRVNQHANVIEAAKKAGVERIVYTSLLHADTSSWSLAEEHHATEKILKNSGVNYSILRNGWYSENYTGSIAGALAGGAFLGSASTGKISSATRADFAEAAATVLTSDGHTNKTYELAGDDAFTLTDLAAEITRQSGKNIPYKDLPESEYANILKSFGLPEGFASAIAESDVCASRGEFFENNKQLSSLIGRPTTTIAHTVSNALSAIK